MKVFFAWIFTLSSFALSAQGKEELMERANDFYQKGKFTQAITLYKKAEARGIDKTASRFNIANSYYQAGKFPEAAAAYRSAVEFSDGQFAPALFNLASVYFQLKQYPECIAAYRRALELSNDNVSGWLYLSEAYSKTGDKVGALYAIEKAHALAPDDISIVYQLSEANIALGDFERATEVVRKGYETHPEEIDFLVYLGDVFRVQKDYEKSAAAYREALGQKADDKDTLYKLADVLAESGKPFLAMDILSNLLQIAPEFSDAAIFLGNLAYDAKFLERAEKAYEAAAKAGNAEALFGFRNMAYDALAVKRDSEALRLLLLAQEFYPDEASLRAEIFELEESVKDSEKSFIP